MVNRLLRDGVMPVHEAVEVLEVGMPIQAVEVVRELGRLLDAEEATEGTDETLPGQDRERFQQSIAPKLGRFQGVLEPLAEAAA